MPCTCDGYESVPSDYETLKAEHKEMKKQLDKLTRMLCLLCREELLLDNDITNLSQYHPEWREIVRWYREHQKYDKKKAALEKLTEEEKILLGLK